MTDEKSHFEIRELADRWGISTARVREYQHRHGLAAPVVEIFDYPGAFLFTAEAVESFEKAHPELVPATGETVPTATAAQTPPLAAVKDTRTAGNGADAAQTPGGGLNAKPAPATVSASRAESKPATASTTPAREIKPFAECIVLPKAHKKPEHRRFDNLSEGLRRFAEGIVLPGKESS